MAIYTGVVTEGSKRARALGFPTINIAHSDGEVSGIYAGRATVDGATYVAAIYADPVRGVLEAHLVGFSGTAVGEVSIELVQKLRESRVFESDEALKRAIADDIEQARALSME